MRENTTEIAAAMAKNGVTQKEVMVLCGVSSGAVSHWVTGRFKPTGKNAILLSKKLGIPVEKIIA